jgi:hypothetical protein
MTMLEPEFLRSVLRYDAVTGGLEWRERPVESFIDRAVKMSPQDVMRSWNTRFAGKPAMTAKSAAGYRFGNIKRSVVYAHRVAWAIVHGAWPSQSIDHINGFRDDNRLANLRDVSHGDNMRNLHKVPAHGCFGVKPYRNHWIARICVHGRDVHLGVHATKDEAVMARQVAEDYYWRGGGEVDAFKFEEAYGRPLPRSIFTFKGLSDGVDTAI